jgi:hypothetical protein
VSLCTVPWVAPAGLAAGWLAWPGLTPAFKEETLGIKQAAAPGTVPAAGAGGPIFRGNGKYKYVKTEIGERPSLAE